MDSHEWKDTTDRDGAGALVGIYILEREDGQEPRLRYQYTDGRSFLSELARADWMPEMLRLATREREMELECAGMSALYYSELRRIQSQLTTAEERERKLREGIGRIALQVEEEGAGGVIWRDLGPSLRALLKEE